MNYNTNTHYSPGSEQPTLGELLSNLSSQAGLLVRQEIQLAQAEMTRKATRAGRNAAYVAMGGIFGLAAFLTIVAALVLALSQFRAAWLAATLVGLALGIVAALLVRYGVEKLKQIDPAPRQTIETMRENKEWLTQQI